MQGAIEQSLNQTQWYLVVDRGAMCEPIAAGPFATKDEAQLYWYAGSDRVVSIRNKNLSRYIARNGDLRPDAIR